ncbi:hypothetical protein LEP1GSC021_3727 [Leptospira noguchii str. 1993005606]|uniref:Uncharacterized protein n=1 Tax=Leptospira noguchii str. 2007001578 TaxID=1049974 RepID=A0ABP2T976_9LEPT|nr:hypothetical protein LEP1GSC035_3099 [Leptospira noguchii str. 2007001578]EPE85557.1 hypothetical protein LEP1GSC021_3727 [Leptospira noguchii str. 1993005606]
MKAFETQQNALYHNFTHKLNRILESKLNSASRSPNSAKRFLRKRFRSLDRSCFGF